MAKAFRFPPYPTKPHKSGQARIKIQGRCYYLGVFGSAESYAEHRRLAHEFSGVTDSAPPVPANQEVTVELVIHRWTDWIRRERGEGWRDLRSYNQALTVLFRLYGSTPAASFGVQELSRVRDSMISGAWMDDEERAERVRRKQPIGWCRNVCNHQVSRLRTVWRWAEEQTLVPRGSWHHLRSLRPIDKTSRRVRHTAERKAATREQLDKILGRVSPPVAAMLELQWHSGMRPSEVIRMRVQDVQLDGPDELWLYWLDGHKGDWREGAERRQAVVLGPECQRVLRPWLDAARSRGEEAFVFPTQRFVRSRSYTVESYARAVNRACAMAGIVPFSPYMLRHAAKEAITREVGLDAARAQLRHRSLGTTAGYSRQQDLKLASTAAKKLG